MRKLPYPAASDAGAQAADRRDISAETAMALACSSGSTSVVAGHHQKGSAIEVHRKLCWIALGSEGRLEQTFSTDQDNGIIFSVRSELPPQRVREPLLPFAAAVNHTLDRCGFPLCKGNIMAGNRRWCLSLAEWRAQFSAWIGNTDPEAVLNSAIFFDFRPVYGDATLTNRLRAWLLEIAQATL